MEPLQHSRKAKPWVGIGLGLVVAVIGVWLLLAALGDPEMTNTAPVVNGDRTGNSNAGAGANVTKASSNVNGPVANTNPSLSVDTSDWPIYTDPDTGLTNRYPSGWVLVKPSYASVGFRPEDPEPANSDWTAVYITYRPNPDSLALEAFYAGAMGYVPLTERGGPMETRGIGNHDGLYFSALPGPVPNAAFAFPDKNVVVEVETHLDGEAAFVYEDAFFGITESIE